MPPTNGIKPADKAPSNWFSLSKSRTTLILCAASSCEVLIWRTDGKLALSQKLGAGEQAISLRGLGAGSYFVSIKSGSGTLPAKKIMLIK